jgi:anti-sigma B factor antagonist
VSLSFNIRQQNHISIVDVAGRITLGDDLHKLRELLRTMPKEDHKAILLNLAECTYIDSSGLGVLVFGFASITNQGGQFKLLNLTTRVRDLLLITKLFAVFEIFDDEATAIDSFIQTTAQQPSITV